jgi:hypothetical protein
MSMKIGTIPVEVSVARTHSSPEIVYDVFCRVNKGEPKVIGQLHVAEGTVGYEDISAAKLAQVRKQLARKMQMAS